MLKEFKTIKYKPQFGDEMDIAFIRGNYLDGDGIYLGIQFQDPDLDNAWMPWCDITVNIEGALICSVNDACVNINDLMDDNFVHWLEENNLAKDTGRVAYSGWCTYPIVTLNMDEVEKYVREVVS